MEMASQHMSRNLADVIGGFPQRSDSWYDLAAQLIVDLKKQIESEGLFISQYFEQGLIEDASNPNADLLLRMHEQIASAISSERRSLESFDTACERIARLIEAS